MIYTRQIEWVQSYLPFKNVSLVISTAKRIQNGNKYTQGTSFGHLSQLVCSLLSSPLLIVYPAMRTRKLTQTDKSVSLKLEDNTLKEMKNRDQPDQLYCVAR
ncbi:hypothetical protein EYC80_004954 [Monilinia laxa]|uniref:Uncharacterized protein n=1 Tax=Monilinia laxa TaxID=61186 RepID=A0A5N6KIN4_MONLA|nr:hypothetical protein EYC80_004954 [Monilinia laxa]